MKKQYLGSEERDGVTVLRYRTTKECALCRRLRWALTAGIIFGGALVIHFSPKLYVAAISAYSSPDVSTTATP